MRLKLGRGKHMSIPKAALIYFYGDFAKETNGVGQFLTWGDYGAMHNIVDIAGAKHISASTATKVSASLAASPYWDNNYCPGMYSGMMGNGGANCYVPS